MSSQPPIPPRPDGLHPVPLLPPRPDTLAVTDDLRPKASWSWYEALVVYIVAFLIAGLATLPLIRLMEPETDLTNIVLTTAAALVILGVELLWLSTYHKGWLEVMRLPERGTWRKEIGSGVLFALGLYPVMVIVVGGLLTYLLQTISGEQVRAPEQVGEHLPAIGTALTIVYAVVIAPVGEELFFRGVLFRSLRDRHGFWVGAVGSAVGFGLIHFIPGSAVDAALLMIVMFFTGVALCFLYERRGTIVAPLAAHITFNVIGIVLILGLR
ncbi:MAG TPA: CPBP family glutamic-type intramembrane protease [Actinomycetota bacterium]|nr:CPBP family glutamic-type intramembrane protease [Actinomycetota bacterium]